MSAFLAVLLSGHPKTLIRWKKSRHLGAPSRARGESLCYAAYTRFRVGEIAGLNWDDRDSEIQVNRSI
jgi:hypothetical protein